MIISTFFKRVDFNLGNSEWENKPTDMRLKNPDKSKDPQLASLFFQFGRYLLISSSRPGTQPATLQGIWNKELWPPWGSKYTLNINAEMNYWVAEVCNLSEMHQPFFEMLKDLSVTGEQTAKVHYQSRGFCVHHNTDIWRAATPVDKAVGCFWPVGGAWLTRHLWEHYLYSKDLHFLEKEAYPLMKKAAVFLVDFLIEIPDGLPFAGKLVTSPSVSPENSYTRPDGLTSKISYGSTMDIQLINDLFENCISAANLLGKDENFIFQLSSILKKLPPQQIGKYGQLQEWIGDWDDPEDKHRHVSHLYGLFPASIISPSATPELFAAAKKSLQLRGDGGTGWSMGWKINLWARLFDGNHALKMIDNQLSFVDTDDKIGGTYANLF